DRLQQRLRAAGALAVAGERRGDHVRPGRGAARPVDSGSRGARGSRDRDRLRRRAEVSVRVFRDRRGHRRSLAAWGRAGGCPHDGSGVAYVRTSGPTAVGVGGTISLRAAVGDASGNPVSNPSVSWTSSNTAIAQVTGVGDTASVTGRQAGYVTITAATGQLSDTLGVQVVGSSAPVASVTVVPGSANLAVGDSVGFRAELRDSTGTLLTDRAVSWFGTDSTVLNVYPYGSQALV